MNMRDLTFITGNQQKADYLAKWLGLPVTHQKLDLDELQSLDVRIVVEHKVRQAYALLQKPVLVEDVGLVFTAMGQLPGTLIKWFLEELGEDGLCKLAHSYPDQTAEAFILYALFDGTDIRYFEARQMGHIATEPKGSNGFGWNTVFIPEGSERTYGEMDDDAFKQWNIRAHAVEKLKQYLTSSANSL